MRNLPESPGLILKTARERAGITVEALAEMADVSERYIYRIENEGKKPSYDVLYHLIRALDLSPDLLFYPEKQSEIQRSSSLFICFTSVTPGPWT